MTIKRVTPMGRGGIVRRNVLEAGSRPKRAVKSVRLVVQQDLWTARRQSLFLSLAVGRLISIPRSVQGDTA